MTKFISDKQQHQTRKKTRRKTKVNLLCLEQELDINECFFPKNFKKPRRIAPCNILERFVQCSHHLEKNHTNLTNKSSKNFKGLKFFITWFLKKIS